LLENYREIGRIMAVAGQRHQMEPRYLFSEISILVPNPN